MGAIIIYTIFVAICIVGMVRPWIGITGFYGCVLLEPNWNWRWSIAEDFEFQKYLAATTFIGVILNSFHGNKFTYPAYRSTACLLCFLLLAYVSRFQSIAPETSAFYMNNLWKITLMALVAILLLDTPRKIWIFLTVMVITQGYSAYQINSQYFQEGICIYAKRAWGSKGDGNLYSNLTVPLVVCSGAICVFAQRRWLQVGCGLIFLLQIHQLMLMESRGAMLATVLELAIFAWYMPKNRFTLTASVAALVMGAALAGPPVVKEFMSAFEKEEKRDSSAQSRVLLWKAGWNIAKDYPWLGVGPYAGQSLVPMYLGAAAEPGGQKGLHNLFFEIATGCGFPATFFYFMFFVIPWFVSWRTYRRNRNRGDPWINACLLATIAGIPGYLAASMFSSGALLESPYALCSLALAANCVLHRQETEEETPAYDDPTP